MLFYSTCSISAGLKTYLFLHLSRNFFQKSREREKIILVTFIEKQTGSTNSDERSVSILNFCAFIKFWGWVETNLPNIRIFPTDIH